MLGDGGRQSRLSVIDVLEMSSYSHFQPVKDTHSDGTDAGISLFQIELRAKLAHLKCGFDRLNRPPASAA